jgi:hypothetical protein
MMEYDMLDSDEAQISSAFRELRRRAWKLEGEWKELALLAVGHCMFLAEVNHFRLDEYVEACTEAIERIERDAEGEQGKP